MMTWTKKYLSEGLLNSNFMRCEFEYATEGSEGGTELEEGRNGNLDVI
jgi:hypothetical protein